MSHYHHLWTLIHSPKWPIQAVCCRHRLVSVDHHVVHQFTRDNKGKTFEYWFNLFTNLFRTVLLPTTFVKMSWRPIWWRQCYEGGYSNVHFCLHNVNQQRPRFLFVMNTMSFFPYQRFKYSAFRNWIWKPLFISLLLQPAFKSATLSPPSVKYCPFKNFKKQDINFQWLLYEESDPITLLKENWFVKDSTVARQTWWKRHLNIVRCVMRMYA